LSDTLIAALFVQDGGTYFNMEGVDPWPEDRDARLYNDNHPVVAHPPCASWCKLAPINLARWGTPIGQDGGCFQSALANVRRVGGVLEHPAYTIAWKEYDIRRPQRGKWLRSKCGGWVTEVSQCAYGHRARKRTWLYYVGVKPFDLDWSEPPTTAAIGNGVHSGRSTGLDKLSKTEASRTPEQFKAVLLELARHSQLPN